MYVVHVGKNIMHADSYWQNHTKKNTYLTLQILFIIILRDGYI